MHISWLGSTGIKLQTKPKNEDINILIDGYKQEKGVFLKTLSPHIALFTQGKENSITLSGDPFVLTTPGEIEIKDVLITAVQGNTVKEVFFRIDTEGISVAHLGKIKEPLNDRQLEVVSGVDILIIPVSGNGLTYNAEQASKAINIIEPRVVIPIAY
jgi:L-ascorbate metabolism protein UlaG (beta-lactamase superfamily)